MGVLSVSILHFDFDVYPIPILVRPVQKKSNVLGTSTSLFTFPGPYLNLATSLFYSNVSASFGSDRESTLSTYANNKMTNC